MSFSPSSIPLLYDVDVAVIGASSGAVAAALEASAAGSRVFVASDLACFGEESAAAIRLWPAVSSDDALFRKLFPSEDSHPPTPMHVKRALEIELLKQKIPFLYHVRPVALLRDEAGVLAGVVLAAKTALYAIRCRAVIDATRHGLLARLASVPLVSRRELPSTVTWTVLADAPLASDESPGFSCREAGTAFSRMGGDGGKEDARAFLLDFDGPRLSGGTPSVSDLAAAETLFRARLISSSVLYTADILPDAAPWHLDSAAPGNDPEELREADYQAAPSLFLLNGLLPLSLSGIRRLEESAVQIALGRRLGIMAARAAGSSGAAGSHYQWSAGGADDGGSWQFANGVLRPGAAREWIEAEAGGFPELGRCDVLVAGGGTAGAPAGIAAAREGARTIVLEMLHGLGGVGTIGQISSYYFGNKVGFTAAIDNDLDAYRKDAPDYGQSRWRPEMKSSLYQRLLRDAGGSAWLGSFVFGVQMRGNRVGAVLVSTPYGSGRLEAGAVVDASGNADVVAAAGAPCRIMDGSHLAVQGTGLSPRWAGHSYNSDHTFIDDNDPAGVTHAFVNARAKFPNYFDTSSMVNSRERRQIIGEVELSPLDFLAERTFPDTVATAFSNFDTHGFTIHPVFMVVPPDKKPLYAHVPFRCLLPQKIDGVLVTGLGMSAHRDAIPVVRMQADTQNHGYAAGLACAWSAARRQALRELDIRELQKRLAELGIIGPEVPAQEDSFPLPDETVREAARTGPVDLLRAAIIFGNPEVSHPVLKEVLERDADPARRENAALVLGLSGCREAAPRLARLVGERPWDEGWNFRGMGQFGMSLSRMDALVIALGRAGGPEAREPLREKIAALDENSEFSHYRAVSLAAGTLGASELAEALARLLSLPGVKGHAQLDTATVIGGAISDRNETTARNLSLRELHLARGLYLCGDANQLARGILEDYARDLRGHYSLHAQAVLRGDGRERFRKVTA